MPHPTPDQIENHPAVINARAAEMRFHYEHPAHAAAWFTVLAEDQEHRTHTLAGQTPTADLQLAQAEYHVVTDTPIREAFYRLLDANVTAWETATADLTKEPS